MRACVKSEESVAGHRHQSESGVPPVWNAIDRRWEEKARGATGNDHSRGRQTMHLIAAGFHYGWSRVSVIANDQSCGSVRQGTVLTRVVRKGLVRYRQHLAVMMRLRFEIRARRRGRRMASSPSVGNVMVTSNHVASPGRVDAVLANVIRGGVTMRSVVGRRQGTTAVN
jgi:hypothetical protein